MVDLVIGIITYPPRYDNAVKMLLKIGGEVRIFNDVDRKGIRWSHRMAWGNLFNEGREWACLLQDDAVLCESFRKKLEVRIETAGKKGYEFFQLFNFHEPSSEQWDTGWEVYSGRNMMCDLGNVFRFSLLRKLLVFWDGNAFAEGFDSRSCDDIIAKFLSKNKIKAVATVPNLIDHDISVESSKRTPVKVGNTIRVSKSFSMGGY